MIKTKTINIPAHSRFAYEQRFHDHLTHQEQVHIQEGLRTRPDAGGDTYWSCLTPSQPPRGLIISLHATGNDAWFGQLPLFATLVRQGYAIYTFDLDGHGRHSNTYLDPANAAAMSLDAWQHATSLVPPDTPRYLLAQSVGGALAMQLLLRKEHSITAASFIGVMHQPTISSKAIVAELLAPVFRGWRHGRRFYSRREFIPAFGSFKREQYPLRIAPHLRQQRQNYLQLIQRIFSEAPFAALNQHPQTPILWITGDHDYLARDESMQRLAQANPAWRYIGLARNNHYTAPNDRRCGELVGDWFQQAAHQQGTKA